MASADLREELNCSICLDLYTEPASLKCGHNFCWDCILTVLDTQEESGDYSCPECREVYTERPPLEKNRKLCNIMEHFRSACQEVTEVLCTYCDPPVPAAKSCLHCEASFCEKHLNNHSKSAHHILIKPTTSFGDRKCSAHHEILKYFCTEDRACICTSCWVVGDHKGHQVELLNEASEKKFKDVLENLNSEKQRSECTIQQLGALEEQEKGRAAEMTEKIVQMFANMKKELGDVEAKALAEVSTQKAQVSHSVSDLIRKQEKQQDNLLRKILEIEDLHKSTDPLIFLKKELNTDYKFTDNIGDLREAELLHEALISRILLSGFVSTVHNTMKKIYSDFPHFTSEVLLDTKTASNYISISKDLKTASCNAKPETRPDGPERFNSRQVLSTRSFSNGKHGWGLSVSGAKEWLIGVAEHTIERKTEGPESYIGYNDKSWALAQRSGLQARHKDFVKNIDSSSSLNTVGIYLDYDAGRLSFYKLCEPMGHLHTFFTNFKEPLHAAFYVFPKSSISIASLHTPISSD